MGETNHKLDEISDQLSENILAVKGTLELLDTSVTEDELHDLLLKAIERLDVMQRLTQDMLAALKSCLEKMAELKK